MASAIRLGSCYHPPSIFSPVLGRIWYDLGMCSKVPSRVYFFFTKQGVETLVRRWKWVQYIWTLNNNHAWKAHWLTTCLHLDKLTKWLINTLLNMPNQEGEREKATEIPARKEKGIKKTCLRVATKPTCINVCVWNKERQRERATELRRRWSGPFL